MAKHIQVIRFVVTVRVKNADEIFANPCTIMSESVSGAVDRRREAHRQGAIPKQLPGRTPAAPKKVGITSVEKFDISRGGGDSAFLQVPFF